MNYNSFNLNMSKIKKMNIESIIIIIVRRRVLFGWPCNWKTMLFFKFRWPSRRAQRSAWWLSSSNHRLYNLFQSLWMKNAFTVNFTNPFTNSPKNEPTNQLNADHFRSFLLGYGNANLGKWKSLPLDWI